MTKDSFKIVVVGDGGCGKTSLIVAEAGGSFSESYTPTAFDDFAIEALVNGKTKTVTVCDTAGENDYDSFRPLSYPDADVILTCYSVERPDSLKNIRDRWLPEIRRFCPNVPVVVVGCKADIREENKKKLSNATSPQTDSDLHVYTHLVSTDEANDVARAFTDYGVVECSAKSKEGVRQVFDTAIKAGVSYRNRANSRVLSSLMKLKLVF